MSEQSTGKTVYFTSDPAQPYQLTAEEQERLDSMADEDIDLSDIPQQTGKPGWHPGRLGAEALAGVRQEALRDGLLMVDPDVVAFFKQTGDRPLERMRAVLREYAEMHRKTA